jgi:hypothetical protein
MRERSCFPMGCSGSRPEAAPSPIVFTGAPATLGSPPPQQAQQQHLLHQQLQPEQPEQNEPPEQLLESGSGGGNGAIAAAAAAAANAALAAQQARFAAAESAPAAVKEFVAKGWNDSDMPAAGQLMERILSHVALIDGHYLVALGEAGGVVPRWQDVPPCARIDASNVWRLRRWSVGFSCPMLCLSYPRRGHAHPDEDGALLAQLVPLLKVLLAEAVACGEHCTVGVLWDYACLPQEPRTPSEEESFAHSLPLFHSAFAHPYSFVLLCTQSLPGVGARPYSSRGWCRLETRLASLVKDSRTLWDFGLFDPAKCLDLTTARRFMKAFRPAFVSPARFAAEVHDGVASGEISFAVPADAELAIQLYEGAFTRAFESFVAAHGEGRKSDMVFYKDLGWGDEDAPVLTEALEWVAAQCDFSSISRLSLNFRENEFTQEGKAMLEAAAKKQPKLMIRVHVVDEPQF